MSLQVFDSLLVPIQKVEGSPHDSQLLIRNCSPPQHVAEQLPHDPQGFHSAMRNSHYNELEITNIQINIKKKLSSFISICILYLFVSQQPGKKPLN